MAECEKCGNQYDKSFEVIMDGESYVFDCFECAVATLAPTCSECGVTIIGHGLEADDKYFCCAHCAHQAGVDMQDRK